MMRRLPLIVVVVLLVLTVPLRAATVTVISEAVRGATSGTASVPGGGSADIVTLRLVSTQSPSWTSLTGASSVVMVVVLTRSTDGGVTFNPMASAVFQSPGVNKNGLLPALSIAYDGLAAQYQYTITVCQASSFVLNADGSIGACTPTTFSWGASATF